MNSALYMFYLGILEYKLIPKRDVDGIVKLKSTNNEQDLELRFGLVLYAWILKNNIDFSIAKHDLKNLCSKIKLKDEQ